MKKDIYYNYHDLLTRNALFSFIIGSRGAGKTFGFKKWAVSSFLKTERQFIYLRRYKSELKSLSTGFFNDVAPFFPEVEFEQKGNKLYINKKLAGYLVSLSNSLVMKSVDLKAVDKIGFDEFVIDKGHLRYLDGEVTKFLEFYETVSRMRIIDDTEGAEKFEEPRAIFISNAVSIVNPYFLHFNLKPKQGSRFTQKGHLLVEYVQNKEFAELKYKTRFGQIIKGTEYGDYAIENKFLVDNENFVEKRTATAHYVCRVIYQNNTYGFWVDYKEGKFFISDKFDPHGRHVYSLTDSDHKPNLMLIKSKRKGFYIDKFIEAYQNGYCYFENMVIKNQAMEMFKMLKG